MLVGSSHKTREAMACYKRGMAPERSLPVHQSALTSPDCGFLSAMPTDCIPSPAVSQPHGVPTARNSLWALPWAKKAARVDHPVAAAKGLPRPTPTHVGHRDFGPSFPLKTSFRRRTRMRHASPPLSPWWKALDWPWPHYFLTRRGNYRLSWRCHKYCPVGLARTKDHGSTPLGGWRRPLATRALGRNSCPQTFEKMTDWYVLAGTPDGQTRHKRPAMATCPDFRRPLYWREKDHECHRGTDNR